MSSATATPLGRPITPRPTPDALLRRRELIRRRTRLVIGDAVAATGGALGASATLAATLH